MPYEDVVQGGPPSQAISTQWWGGAIPVLFPLNFAFFNLKNTIATNMFESN